MRRVWVHRPLLLLTLLILLLLRDHSGLARTALLASVLHETGHVLAYWCLRRELPALSLSPCGIALRWQSGIGETPRRHLLVAAAGPAVNLLLCAGALTLMQVQASYWGYTFAGVNLCTGLFNLLPLGGLDGARILTAVRELCR